MLPEMHHLRSPNSEARLQLRQTNNPSSILIEVEKELRKPEGPRSISIELAEDGSLIVTCYSRGSDHPNIVELKP